MIFLTSLPPFLLRFHSLLLLEKWAANPRLGAEKWVSSSHQKPSNKEASHLCSLVPFSCQIYTFAMQGALLLLASLVGMLILAFLHKAAE